MSTELVFANLGTNHAQDGELFDGSERMVLAATPWGPQLGNARRAAKSGDSQRALGYLLAAVSLGLSPILALAFWTGLMGQWP
jgi:hypothetical protein